MDTGIVLLNFGEPEEPEKNKVVSYLKRIFLANASLEEQDSGKEAEKRAQKLAERRAPSLVEEYKSIGGSPLNEHARIQKEKMQDEIDRRGYNASVYIGMQYTDPFIEDTVKNALMDGVEKIIGLPVYPLCGPSTTVDSLERLSNSVKDHNSQTPVYEITGWHKHPVYNRIRAENIMSFAEKKNINIKSSDTKLIFSAHGTPIHYLENGNRYNEYVEEYCQVISSIIGIKDYIIGYQNHENRDIPWTKPEVEEVIKNVESDKVLVEPISFMHEQSETLFELDHELKEEANEIELDFYRVPVPYDDSRFSSMLVDLVEPFLANFSPAYYNMKKCICRENQNTFCFNSKV